METTNFLTKLLKIDVTIKLILNKLDKNFLKSY
jgi:hypothetical protein